MKIAINFLVVGAFFLAACGGDNKKTRDNNAGDGKNPDESCTYLYDDNGTEVNWTAYKFTEAVGVKGKFKEIRITDTEEANNPHQVFRKASFDIPISSISSGDTSRDRKIRQYFFGTLSNTASITGTVKSLDAEKAKAVINLKLNNIERPVEMNYTMSGDTLMLDGFIRLENWKAENGIQRLNEECKALHTGADGKSFLSPEVTLAIRSVLKRKCD